MKPLELEDQQGGATIHFHDEADRREEDGSYFSSVTLDAIDSSWGAFMSRESIEELHRWTGALLRPPAGEPMEMAPGACILLDVMGSMAIQTQPDGDAMVMVDLEGKLNKKDERAVTRWLMAVGQAAELVVDIVLATKALPQEHREHFTKEFQAALVAAGVRE